MQIVDEQDRLEREAVGDRRERIARARGVALEHFRGVARDELHLVPPVFGRAARARSWRRRARRAGGQAARTPGGSGGVATTIGTPPRTSSSVRATRNRCASRARIASPGTSRAPSARLPASISTINSASRLPRSRTGLSRTPRRPVPKRPDEPLHVVGRDGKLEAAGQDHAVDPDDASARICERAARIARRESQVGLNEAGRPAGECRVRDPHRESVRDSQRMSVRDHRA